MGVFGGPPRYGGYIGVMGGGGRPEMWGSLATMAVCATNPIIITKGAQLFECIKPPAIVCLPYRMRRWWQQED